MRTDYTSLALGAEPTLGKPQFLTRIGHYDNYYTCYYKCNIYGYKWLLCLVDNMSYRSYHRRCEQILIDGIRYYKIKIIPEDNFNQAQNVFSLDSVSTISAAQSHNNRCRHCVIS